MKNNTQAQLEFTTEVFKDKTLITKVTYDKPDMKKIVEAQKRITGRGNYQPSEAYIQYRKKQAETIFPKEPCRSTENVNKVDKFFTNLFKVQAI